MNGRTLVHFRIVEKIGAGGMGEIYEALDTELDRKVAIKVLPADVAGQSESLERFRREAKAVAALDHPNIVTIYSVEEADDVRFLVMEFVDGVDLSRRISSESLSVAQALDVGIPIAAALAAAHERGIIHRDLKPANVMLTRDGRVKLLDFGLAKLATETGFMSTAAVSAPLSESSAETRDAALTRAGILLGTAPYLAPEQLQGRPVDRRVDIFALGIVLYEMLGGRRPFEGETGAQLFASILKDTPTALSKLRPDVPDRLEAVVARCLEKDPDRRYQNASDVARELESVREEHLAALHPRPPRRPAWLAMGATVVGLGIALATAAYLYTIVEPSNPESAVETATQRSDRTMIAVLPFENLGEADDAYFTAGVTEEIMSRLAGLDGLGVISRSSTMQYKDSRPPIKQIAAELGVAYLLEGTVRWQRMEDGTSRVRVTPQLIDVSKDLQLWTEPYDASLEDIFRVQTDIATQVITQLDMTLAAEEQQAIAAPLTESMEAYDFFLRANEYLHRGRELHQAEPVHFAIDMYEEAVSLDASFALANAKEALANAWLYYWHFDRTDARIQAAQDAVDRAFASDDGLAEAHHALGVIRLGRDDLEGATKEFQTVLQAQPNNTDAFYWISHALSELGERDKAAAYAARASELTPRHADLACWAGGCAQAVRDYRAAIRHHDLAIKLAPDRTCHYYCEVEAYLNWDGTTERARAFLDSIPANVRRDGNPSLNWWLVQVELLDRKYDVAIDRIHATDEEVLSSPWHYIPKPLLLAFGHRMRGENDLARGFYEESVTILKAASEERPEDGRLRSSLGVAYAGLGLREEAIREGELGFDLLSGSKGDSWSYRLTQLAEIYVLLDMREEAIDLLEELLSQPAFVSGPRLDADPLWDALRDHPRFRALIASNTESVNTP